MSEQNSVVYQTPAGWATYHRQGSRMMIIVPDNKLPYRMLLPEGAKINASRIKFIECHRLFKHLMLLIPIQGWEETRHQSHAPRSL